MTSRTAEGGAGHMVALEETFSPVKSAASAFQDPAGPLVNSSVNDVKQTVGLRQEIGAPGPVINPAAAASSVFDAAKRRTDGGICVDGASRARRQHARARH